MKIFIRVFLIFVCSYTTTSFGQDSLPSGNPLHFEDKYLRKVTGKASAFEHKFDAASDKALQSFMASQQKLFKKIAHVDSNAAKDLVNKATQRYKELQDRLNQPGKLNQYVPYLDSLSTSVNFLQQAKANLPDAGPSLKKLQEASDQLKKLGSQMQKAEDIRRYIKEQKQLLKEQLDKIGMVKDLKKLNKQAYYYQQQLEDYKTLLQDQDRLERKALELLGKTKPFQEFTKRNSFLAGLFNISPDPADPSYQANMAGLQTRFQLNQSIQDRIGSGPNATALLRDRMKEMKTVMADLRTQLPKAHFSASDPETPDFKPNTEKTKPLLKRLEYSFNLQSQQATFYFPTTSDIGLGMGYKLNQNGSIGIGVASKVGWGKSWNNIDVTYQGVSLRSYLDWKIKGSFYVSGGYEMNYKSEIERMEQLKDYTAWQRSGLVGVSKLVSLRSKFLKKTKLQLLWDFLSYQQVPRSQVLLFRVGYVF